MFRRLEAKQRQSREEYFAALEQQWTQRAKEEGLANQLVVVDSEARPEPGLYDVLQIDSKGKAKRVGGYGATDIGGGGPFVGEAMEALGADGIKILNEEGFPALLEAAKAAVF